MNSLLYLFVCLMVFNATFNNISVILWPLVLLVEETGGLGENHRPVTSHFFFPVDLMDILFNQEQMFYNSTLADTSYHLLTSIYYKNSLNLTMSLVTKYYP
jgi:hypothetical protein